MPRNPKSNDMMSCRFSCASSVRFRQCGPLLVMPRRLSTGPKRNGRRVQLTLQLTWFCWRFLHSRFSTLSDRWKALRRLAVFDSVTADFAAQLTICIQQVPDLRRNSTETPSPLLFMPVRHACCPNSTLNCCSLRRQHWIHDVCYHELHPNLSRRDEVQLTNTVVSKFMSAGSHQFPTDWTMSSWNHSYSCRQ